MKKEYIKTIIIKGSELADGYKSRMHDKGITSDNYGTEIADNALDYKSTELNIECEERWPSGNIKKLSFTNNGKSMSDDIALTRFILSSPTPATHYTDDINRDSAYVSVDSLLSSTAVPYSLTYINSPKRFTRETNEDNTTSLVFGNGILRNGSTIGEQFIDLEQAGVIIPGQTNDLNEAIDPLLGDEYSTLGESPMHTILTVKYRVGGGISANVPSGDLTNLVTYSSADGSTTGVTLTGVTNNLPAVGGRDGESIDELKQKIKSFFSTQNRCVTKEDYEARALALPSKFGSVAKVYCRRSGVDSMGSSAEQLISQLDLNASDTVTPDDVTALVQYITTAISENDTTWSTNLGHPLTQAITRLQGFVSLFS